MYINFITEFKYLEILQIIVMEFDSAGDAEEYNGNVYVDWCDKSG